MNSIAELLISEVIIRENLRVKRRLPMSNQDISYSVKSITVNRPNMQNESTSLIKKISRILIRPSGGDDIVFFYLPFSVLLFLFPYPIISKLNLRLIDIYFFYLCAVNIILPFLKIYRNISQQKLELAYRDVWND